MREPSRIELMCLWLLTSIIFVAVILHFESYTSKVDEFGDSAAYMAAAAGIHAGQMRNIQGKNFWGVSYATALLSNLFEGSQRISLLVVCAGSSLAAVLLAHQLWGGWIAGFFAVLNLGWLQTSHLGGAEPLFMALLLGSLWAARHDRWIWATTLASLATVTRPVGVFALVALGLTLLAKRDYKILALCTGIALGIGALYLLPFWIYFGGPLYQVHLYRACDWQSGPPVTWPFYASSRSIIHDGMPWTNLLHTLGWITFVAIGMLAMTREKFRQYFHEHKAEGYFALLYGLFLFTYNSSVWARAEFVRFSIPVLPFVLVSLSGWIPRSRALLYSLGTLSAALAACSAIGLKNVFAILR